MLPNVQLIELVVGILLIQISILDIVVKGNSHNLLKAGAKRRRTKAELEREKLAEAERLRDIATKMGLVNQMQAELERLRVKEQMMD